MSKRKLDSKAFANQKRKKRQWITFLRMCRYGVNNFSRNAWLTIAATAVMTITLLVVFTAMSARSVLVDTVGQIRDKVDMSIYLKNSTTNDQAGQVANELRQLSSVESVSYISPAEARESFAQNNSGSSRALEALNEATNQLPGTLRITVDDINDTTQLDEFTDTNPTLAQYVDPDRPASFAGERRVAIQNIGRWIGFAERVGIVASIVFMAISSLIIFNTIRMAIFNRREEIQMMKLIGADRAFIRGPFLVEAMVYGVIAAVIATAIGMAMLYASREQLLSYDVAVQPTIDFVTLYIGIVIMGMIALGALIGVISSLLATRRYLKV